MKINLFVTIAMLFLTSSCAVQSVEEVISINNEKDKNKIQILLDASDDLNLINGEAQEISVCIYELNWKGPFATKAFNDNEARQKKLLECKAFDRSVNKVSKVTVKPGEQFFFEIERYKNLNQIAIVADYHSYSPKTSIRLHNVPKGIANGWEWMKKDNPSPFIVTITHNLGKSGILKIKKQ